jgi:hypothetical protein
MRRQGNGAAAAGLRAVVIDASEAAQLATRSALRQTGLFAEVISFSRPEDAVLNIAAADGLRADLILIDRGQMPTRGGNGGAAATDAGPGQTPVILLGTFAPDETIPEILPGLGPVRGTLEKPFPPSALEALIAELG